MRKNVLASLSALLISSFLAVLAIGCSSEVNGKVYTSTETNGHTHTVLIPDSDFANPPREKIYTLSRGADGHTHKIGLAEVNFINMSHGIEVTRPTSTAEDGHSHKITLQ